MDPHDRLWAHLIFPLCEPAALLALRATCRSFLAQLDAAPAHLWQPLTMFVSRMRYAERLLGWRGVRQAMERERITWANCDTGRAERGPALDAISVDDDVHLAGGRVAAFRRGATRLFDMDGTLVATFDTTGRTDNQTVLDRWIPFDDERGHAMLLDCVSARLVSVTQVLGFDVCAPVTVSGPCVSYCVVRHAGEAESGIVIVHVSAGPDGATAVRTIAHVPLVDTARRFTLCERGRAYVLCRADPPSMQLYDIDTCREIRSIAAPPDVMGIHAVAAFACGAFLSVWAVNTSGRFGMYACRLRDGLCTSVGDFVPVVCVDGRARPFDARHSTESRFVDAVTNVPLSPRGALLVVAMDTSGAQFVQDSECAALATRGDARGSLCDVADLPDCELMCVRYGTALVMLQDVVTVLRFDSQSCQ